MAHEMMCPACGCKESGDVYGKLKMPGSLCRCVKCGLCFMRPDPLYNGREQVYDKHYYDQWSLDDLGFEGLSRMKQATFEHLFDMIAAYKQEGTLLDIGCAFGDLLIVAAKRGWTGYGVELSVYAATEAKKKIPPDRIWTGDFISSYLPRKKFNVITMIDVIEHTCNTPAVLKKCYDMLEPNGLLAIVTPDFDSLSRKIMGKGWPHFKMEHLIYFSRRSIVRSLTMSKFEILEVLNFRKALNLYYVMAQFSSAEKASFLKYPAKLAGTLLPDFVKKKNFFMLNGEMLVLAGKKAG